MDRLVSKDGRGGTVPYRTVPYVPYCTVPYRTVPYRTVPYCTVPFRPVPFRTTPYRTVAYRTVPYRTVRTVSNFAHEPIQLCSRACPTLLTSLSNFAHKPVQLCSQASTSNSVANSMRQLLEYCVWHHHNRCICRRVLILSQLRIHRAALAT